MVYDVIIIGAGVIGAFVARVLSEYNINTCLLDKEADLAMGTSKANSAIVHAGYDAIPGSLKAILNVMGNEQMEQVCKELDVPFKRIGSLVLAFKEEEKPDLQALMKRGFSNGVIDLSIINKDEIRSLEPNISHDAKYALLSATAGIVCPYELTYGAIENSMDNGVELKLEQNVKEIRFDDNRFIVSTDKEDFSCSYLVNAAGLFSDKISRMIGDNTFSITPRRGEYMVLDKAMGGYVSKVVFQLPTKFGKGIVVTPTVHGNLMIGPNAEDIEDREDVSTSMEGLNEIILGATKSIPNLQCNSVITSFAGIRAKPSGGDFIIGPSIKNERFINVAGIESPGLTAAPAIGRYVAEKLKSKGLVFERRNNYNPIRKPIIRVNKISEKEWNEVIAENPLFGRVVCRCERVTEGEIVDCIKRNGGAKNLDAVKRRTRAGMGRCQGGFCTSRIVEILSRELSIPAEAVTKMGGMSNILMGRLK